MLRHWWFWSQPCLRYVCCLMRPLPAVNRSSSRKYIRLKYSELLLLRTRLESDQAFPNGFEQCSRNASKPSIYSMNARLSIDSASGQKKNGLLNFRPLEGNKARRSGQTLPHSECCTCRVRRVPNCETGLEVSSAWASSYTGLLLVLSLLYLLVNTILSMLREKLSINITFTIFLQGTTATILWPQWLCT